MHFGHPRAETEPTSPTEGGRFNSELPNTQRHHLGNQIQSVGPSSPITAQERFRLWSWPTVSTHLLQGKVKNRGECGRVYLRFAWRWEKHFRACGRAILPLGGVQIRLHTWPTVPSRSTLGLPPRSLHRWSLPPRMWVHSSSTEPAS